MAATNSNKEDRFSQFMFGNRSNIAEKKEDTKLTDNLSQIDYMQLMEHVDDFMNAYDHLKPTINKLNPLVSQIFKKMGKE